jgi:hypothetical protein
LRSLKEIQPDFEEEAKAYAGLWSQRKKEICNFIFMYTSSLTEVLTEKMCNFRRTTK